MAKKQYTAEEAIASLLAGKEKGLSYFFDRYYPPLTYFARSYLHDSEAARDIVKDSFVKLWERRDLLGTSGSIKSYLYTTVRNACIDVMRRERRKQVYLNEALATAETEELPVWHRIIEAETMHQVFAAVERLPPKCGRIFRMFYLEGKELKEIADELNLSLSTVKSQKGRAVELLRKKVLQVCILIALLQSAN